MGYDAGDEYDCDACGGTHEVRTGKDLRVAGADGGLDPAPYVRCPEAGYVPLGEGSSPPPGGDGNGDWP